MSFQYSLTMAAAPAPMFVAVAPGAGITADLAVHLDSSSPFVNGTPFLEWTHHPAVGAAPALSSVPQHKLIMFLLRHGVEPEVAMRILCLPDVHFVLEVHVLGDGISMPVASPLSSVYLASLIRVQELGEAFRLEQERKKAERLAAEAKRLADRALMPPPPPVLRSRVPRPSFSVHGGDLSDEALRVAFADSLTFEQAKPAAGAAILSRDLAPAQWRSLQALTLR